MGIIPFKFSEYILSVYHNGIVRSNSTRKDACWRLSCVALRSHVAMVQSPVRGIPSNAMYPTFNLNQMETKMHWDKRNLKLRNLHKLLSPCRGTCLHVSMKFTERSISFDLWIKKKRCILNRPDGYFWILCPWNKSADHTGEPWTKHYCTDSSQSQLLSSVSWHVHKCTICTSINAPDNECRTAVGRRWSLHLTTLPVFKGQHSLLYSYSKRKGGWGGEVECVWNVMAHGDAREGKWRGNWRMGWVASTLTLPRKADYPALLPPMRTPRLPAVDWTDAPADLNGLVRFIERRNLVSTRVPSRFKRTLLLHNVIWQVTSLLRPYVTPTCFNP